MEVIQLYENKVSPLQGHAPLVNASPLPEEDYPYIAQERFSLLKQMPQRQVEHFLLRACQTQKEIIIQINPTPTYQKYIEVTGQVSILKESKQIFVTSPAGGFTYLLNPQIIRHIRLSDPA